LRAGRKSQQAGAIDSGRQCQGAFRPRGLVDGALQGSGLVVGAAGPHAELGDIAPERGRQRRGPGGIAWHRQGAGDAGSRCPDQMAAIDVHDPHPPAKRVELL
jgi:hypothetical protein